MRTLISIGAVISSFIFFMIAHSAVAGEPSVAIGSDAPDFRLVDQNGDWHELDDYRGGWLAIYFYPKDDTPGCTAEACAFRDNIFAFRKIGAKIVGISVDDAASHKAFAEKYGLPFSLLADTNGETASRYGVLSNRSMAKRQTFLIDPSGRIAKHYDRVDADTHSEEVLADLKELQSATAM